jgi:hypothetical protein
MRAIPVHESRIDAPALRRVETGESGIALYVTGYATGCIAVYAEALY